MENILEHLEWRYAVKKFDENRMLSEAQIERLKMAFNLTATSYGLQPIKLVVIKDKKLQQRLVAHSFDQLQVAQASHVLVFCVQQNIDAEYIKNYFARIKEIRGTSDEFLDPFKEEMTANFGAKSKEEIQNWAAKQAYLAMGNLLTVCAIEKIDSCPMEGFSPEGYNALLDLESYGLSAVLVLPVGYRAEDDMFSEFKKVRRSIEESIIEINTNNSEF